MQSLERERDQGVINLLLFFLILSHKQTLDLPPVESFHVGKGFKRNMETLAPFPMYFTPEGKPKEEKIFCAYPKEVKGRTYIVFWDGEKEVTLREDETKRRWWKEIFWWIWDAFLGK